MEGFGATKRGEVVVQLKGITKRFPGGVVANSEIDFELRAGEIHALLGENGAGKTTLMRILDGILQPDEGEIYFRGKRVTISSPKEAIVLGIGMVHQHFMLVPTLTAAENIILGLRSTTFFISSKSAEKRIGELSQKYGLGVNPKAIVGQLSVGEQQRVEILKALYRGAKVLILDEPTAVLTPTETKQLMSILKGMAVEGTAVLPFITHKLPEVMSISDRVTVLRHGKVVASMATASTDERDLARKMIGRDLENHLRSASTSESVLVLEVENARALSDDGSMGLKGVSLSLYSGEILGIAGVAGNGQRELAEVITGLRAVTEGRVRMTGQDITNRPVHEMIELGMGHVPEDRLGTGAIGDFSIAENLVLEAYDKPPFARKRFLPIQRNWFLDSDEIDKHAEKLIASYNIVAPGGHARAKTLSGGNLQKLILARELSKNPKLLIAAQPTRGLDIGATEDIRRILTDQRANGLAIMLISEDLDEIMLMSDRIAVMYEGEIVGVLNAASASTEEIGGMMSGIRKSTPGIEGSAADPK